MIESPYHNKQDMYSVKNNLTGEIWSFTLPHTVTLEASVLCTKILTEIIPTLIVMAKNQENINCCQGAAWVHGAMAVLISSGYIKPEDAHSFVEQVHVRLKECKTLKDD